MAVQRYRGRGQTKTPPPPIPDCRKYPPKIKTEKSIDKQIYLLYNETNKSRRVSK